MHEVLGDVAGHVSRGAVDLRGVFAGEASASVGAPSAVGVHNYLASGESGVSGGASDDEFTGRVDQQLEAAVEELRGVLGQGGDKTRKEDRTHVFFNLAAHFFFDPCWTVLGACVSI